MKSPGACTQYRAAVAVESGCNAQAGRNQVPGVLRAKPADGADRFASLDIDGAKVLTDRPAVVEPHTSVHGQPLAYRDGIGHKKSCCDESTAVDRGIGRDR